MVDGDRNLVVVVANPYSGSGPNRLRVDGLRVALGRHGFEPRVAWDPTERATALRDPDVRRRCRCVVAAGGDGTVADAINELPDGMPFAVLPIGNENVFARAFGFRTDAALLARALAAGRTRLIDLGRLGSRFWSLMVSVGFDAEVVHRIARWRARGASPRRMTRLHYAWATAGALRSYPHHRIELTAGGTRVRGALGLVFNVPDYALRLRFAPDARADDGWLDWIVFEHPGRWELVKYAVALFRGRHLEAPGVHSGRAARVRIESAAPVPVQVDGEAWGLTPVAVDVAPRALRVLLV
jgi:diacylglycerol kinase family enzyme